jgi:hypothetical protein
MKTVQTLTAATLFLASSLASAVELSIVPATASVDQGSSVSVDVVISGLGNYAAPSLGAFFAEIQFDDSLLDLSSVLYGPDLGDPTDPSETDISTTTGVSVVSLDEFSFVSDVELDVLQPSSFTLATVTFTGQAVGVAGLSFGGVDLSDVIGTTIYPTLNPGSIQVNATNGVPAPATAALLLPCLLMLARRARHI